MKVAVHRAKSRGHINRKWLETYLTFSFAEYFDPNRVNFGTLRVLNDNTIAPGKSFSMHSHNNMEIISILLDGDLEHQDDKGHKQIIDKDSIQVISAGSGIRHSKYNKNNASPVEFLQIWILPDKQDVAPRYECVPIGGILKPNQLNEIVKPYPGDDQGGTIYQQAWISMGKFDQNAEITYTLKSETSYGVYIFVISGEIIINEDIELLRRDGMGITQCDSFRIRTLMPAEIILIEVPALK